jgi:hypothetical protein
MHGLSGSTARLKKNFTGWQDFLKIFLNGLARVVSRGRTNH